MFVLLCLALVVAAAVHAAPAGKVIPVFEDVTDLRQQADPRLARRTLCFDDCHHHVLHKPVFVVRSTTEGHSLHYAPLGLNGLAKSPLTMPLHEAILAPEANNVIAIFPFARFPFELFPGLREAELAVPEHAARLSSFYREAPVVAVFAEDEFRKINEQRGLVRVADLSADSTGFTISKDHALLNRNAALTAPTAAPAVPMPAHEVAHEVSPAVHPLIFAQETKSAVHPITGIPQYTGGVGAGGGTQKFIHYTPVGATYYTSVPVY